MSQSIAHVQKRYFPLFPRRLFVELTSFTVFCWAAFSLVMLIIPIGVSFVRPIELSGWGLVQQVVNWYVLVIGIHVGWGALEQYVTHGQSRRSFLQSAAVFVVVWPLAIAAMTAVTFFPEALIYRMAGWPQAVREIQLYDSVLNVPMVIIQHWLTLMLWTAGGVALGLGWYRGTLAGSLAILLAMTMGGVGNLSMSRVEGMLGVLVREAYLPQEPQLWLAVLTHVLCTAVLLGFSYVIGRDVPIRQKAA